MHHDALLVAEELSAEETVSANTSRLAQSGILPSLPTLLARAEVEQAAPVAVPEPQANGATTDLFGATRRLLERQHRLGPVPPAARNGPLAPSVAQERVWQLSQAIRHSPYFNVGMAWEIAGELDAAALEQALDDLWQRHEILRSSFQGIAGEPLVTLRQERLKLTRQEVTGPDPAARRAAALALATQELQQPADLKTDALFKPVLFDCGANVNLLLLKLHQIVFDGSSMALLTRELKYRYGARVAAAGPRTALGAHGSCSAPHCGQIRAAQELCAPAVQYYDFAAWQRRLLTNGLLAEEEAFWRARFAEPYRPLPWGEGVSPASAMSGPARQSRLRLPPPVCAALTQLAGEAQTTAFGILLAGFQAFLHRYTGHDDILVFATMAGRHQRELRDLIGLVANVVPFRAPFAARESFRDFLKRAGALATEAIVHQALPLANILQHIELAGPKQAGGLFQAMLIYQSAGLPGFAVGQTTFTPIEGLDNGSGKFGLQLDLWRTQRGVEGWLKCRTDMFDLKFGERLAQGFAEFLAACVRQPNDPLPVAGGRLPVGSPSAEPPGPCNLQPATCAETAPVTRTRPADPLEQSIARLWEKVLKVSPVGAQDDFFKLGGDSFAAVQVMLQVEKLTGSKLPVALLLQAPTVEGLARVIRGKTFQPRWTSLVPIKIGGSRRPIYFVHGEGGKVVGLHNLAIRLAEDQPVYGFESVGLDGEQRPFTRMEDMAAHYIKEMREFQPAGPYALAGVSVGGMVAYEMAQQLLAQQQRVSLLLLLDTFPPVSWEDAPGWQRAAHEMRFQLRRLGYHASRLARLSWPEKVRCLRESLQVLQSRFESTRWQRAYHRRSRQTEQLSASFVDVTESNNLARKNYQYRPYPGRVIWFRAMEEGLSKMGDPEAAWRQFALGGLEVRRVPGNHVSLTRLPHVITLARELQQCLDATEVQAGNGS